MASLAPPAEHQPPDQEAQPMHPTQAKILLRRELATSYVEQQNKQPPAADPEAAPIGWRRPLAVIAALGATAGAVLALTPGDPFSPDRPNSNPHRAVRAGVDRPFISYDRNGVLQMTPGFVELAQHAREVRQQRFGQNQP